MYGRINIIDINGEQDRVKNGSLQEAHFNWQESKLLPPHPHTDASHVDNSETSFKNSSSNCINHL